MRKSSSLYLFVHTSVHILLGTHDFYHSILERKEVSHILDRGNCFSNGYGEDDFAQRFFFEFGSYGGKKNESHQVILLVIKTTSSQWLSNR